MRWEEPLERPHGPNELNLEPPEHPRKRFFKDLSNFLMNLKTYKYILKPPQRPKEHHLEAPQPPCWHLKHKNNLICPKKLWNLPRTLLKTLEILSTNSVNSYEPGNISNNQRNFFNILEIFFLNTFKTHEQNLKPPQNLITVIRDPSNPLNNLKGPHNLRNIHRKKCWTSLRKSGTS